MTYRQVAARESRDMCVPVIFGLILTLFAYILTMRCNPFTYGLSVCAIVWQTAILAVLFGIRRDVIRWAKVYRSL